MRRTCGYENASRTRSTSFRPCSQVFAFEIDPSHVHRGASKFSNVASIAVHCEKQGSWDQVSVQTNSESANSVSMPSPRNHELRLIILR